MVSSGEIWFQMAGSLINRNCCLQSFPKGIEEMVQVSLTSESVRVLNVCLCVYLYVNAVHVLLEDQETWSFMHAPAVVFAERSSLGWTSTLTDWIGFNCPLHCTGFYFNCPLRAVVPQLNRVRDVWVLVRLDFFRCAIPQLCQALGSLGIKTNIFTISSWIFHHEVISH